MQRSETVENKQQPDISFLISRGSQLLRQGQPFQLSTNSKKQTAVSKEKQRGLIATETGGLGNVRVNAGC